jgi:hypothetical protein
VSRVFLTLSLGLFCAACLEPERCCVRESRSGQETAVVLTGCRDTGECPSGLRCVAGGAAEELCSTFYSCCEGSSIASACMLAEGSPPMDLLTRQFGVPRASLEREGVDGFRFELSEQIVATQCALFTCDPAVRSVGGRLALVNFHACARLQRLHSGPSGVFELRFADPVSPQPSRQETPCQIEHATREVFFGVACWGYDEVSLVEATDLIVLRDDEVEALGSFADCATAAAGATCRRFLEGEPGECDGEGSCQRRCITDADCASTVAGADGLPTPDPASVCARPPSDFLGRCQVP